MRKVVELTLPPEHATDMVRIRKKAAERLKLAAEEQFELRLLRRSIDARGRKPLYRLRAEVSIRETSTPVAVRSRAFQQVHNATPVHIIGAGPAGYFAALELLEHGLKPVIFDRGKDVRQRRRDLRAIQQFGVVDPHSNYCFGEGGAGTYSDGKLYTRSHKRGDIAKVLELLVEAGATSDILIDAHPHIGSNKLPGVVANIRQTILEHGGEIHFEAHVTDIGFNNASVKHLIINDKEEVTVSNVVLATGHSARDIYCLLSAHNVHVEFKPFALGVRIEHPQKLIDQIQYNLPDRGAYLPAASYRLACQVGARGVFSFCMCPGGLIVPTATAPGEIVVNGMSLSRRDSAFANAGTVVAVNAADLGEDSDPLRGMNFQARVEKKAFEVGEGGQAAPAQRLVDFLDGRLSSDLPATSYIPGIFSYPVAEILPAFVVRSLKAGIEQFGKRMPGYLTNSAVVVATESRTSSPVRIPRDPDTLMHPQILGLFPTGEGAGYAGGIVSAAMDGQRVAAAVADRVQAVGHAG